VLHSVLSYVLSFLYCLIGLYWVVLYVLEVPKENRYGTLKLTMFKLGGTTKLRGKAGEIRAFGQVLSRLWDMYSNQNLVLHQKMSLCLQLGVRMETILDEHPEDFALPGVHVFGVCVCAYNCLIAVLWLSYNVFYMCLMWLSREIVLMIIQMIMIDIQLKRQRNFSTQLSTITNCFGTCESIFDWRESSFFNSPRRPILAATRAFCRARSIQDEFGALSLRIIWGTCAASLRHVVLHMASRWART